MKGRHPKTFTQAAVRIRNRKQRGLGKPETFTFLGFTLISGKTRRGVFQLKRKTRSDRMRANLKEIREELRWQRHHSIPQQGQWLQQVVRGFYAYHAVPTNILALAMFRRRVIELWWQALRKRSQRDQTTRERARKIADDWLPKPKILHPWPETRFAVKHPRWEAYAGKPHVRFCAGALSNGRPYRVRLHDIWGKCNFWPRREGLSRDVS